MMINRIDYDYNVISRHIPTTPITTHPLSYSPPNPHLNPLLQSNLKLLPLKEQQEESPHYFNQIQISTQSLSQLVYNSFVGKDGDQLSQEQREHLKKITKHEYLKLLKQMGIEMQNCWEKEDKVAALQKSIQSIKTLWHYKEDQPFLASRYSIVQEIITQFASRVYWRITKIQQQQVQQSQLKQKGQFDQKSKTIIKNWLLKTGSIREILPRIFIQISLLRVFSVISPQGLYHEVYRLSHLWKAIGHPQLALYHLHLLIHSINQILFSESQYNDQLYQVYIGIFQQLIQLTQVHDVFDYHANHYLLEPILALYFSSVRQLVFNNHINIHNSIFELLLDGQKHHPIFMKNLIKEAETQLISSNLTTIIKLLNNYDNTSQLQIYIEILSKLKNINITFRVKQQIAMKIDELLQKSNDFLLQLKLIIQFILTINQNAKKEEKILDTQQFIKNMNYFFKQIDELETDEKSEAFNNVQQFIQEVLENSQNMEDMSLLDPFIQIIQFFPKKIKRNCSQLIINKFISNKKLNNLNDPQVIKKIINLMQEVDPSQLLQTVVELVQRLDLGFDLELELQIMTDLRKHFSQNWEVIRYIIHQVLKILPKAKKIARNRISSKLHDFLKSCIAFAHISVSCIDDEFKQFQLYILVSQMALQFNMVNQAESIIKNCIRLIPNLQFQDQNQINFFQGVLFNELLQTLIVFPDNPEKETQEILLGLKNSIQMITFNNNNEINKLIFLGKIVKYLGIQCQQELPYHFQGLQSNDELYRDEEYKEKLKDILQMNLEDMLELSHKAIVKQEVHKELLNELVYLVLSLQQDLSTNQLIKTLKINLIKCINQNTNAKDIKRIQKKLAQVQ